MEQYAGIHAISTKMHSEPAPQLNHFILSWGRTFDALFKCIGYDFLAQFCQAIVGQMCLFDLL
jgi:hypothetical protein